MKLLLPPINIESIPPHARDWLLAESSSKGQSPVDVMISTMARRASRAGFPRQPQPRPEPRPQTEEVEV